MDKTVPAVDIQPKPNYESVNDAFFAIEPVKTWKLMRKGEDIPDSTSVIGIAWNYYPQVIAEGRSTIWDGVDYTEGPLVRRYIAVNTNRPPRPIGMPEEVFDNAFIINSFGTSSIINRTYMQQSHRNEDYGEFRGALDGSTLGVRFGISYGGKEVEILPQEALAMDYSVTKAASVNMHGPGFTYALRTIDPENADAGLNIPQLLITSAVVVGSAAIPETWPSWIAVALGLTNSTVWALIDSTSGADWDKSGSTHAYSQGFGLERKIDDGGANVYSNTNLTPTEPWGHNVEHGVRYENRSALSENLKDMCEPSVGNIVGAAISLHARVQMQSADTVWGSDSVYGEAEASLKNLTWDYSIKDGDAQPGIGGIRVECSE